MKYSIQKSSNPVWVDESGTEIPYNRTTKVERLHERYAGRIVKKALDATKRLKDLNNMLTELSEEAYEAYMESKGVCKRTKGNFTWFNFDRSVKIEININEPIVFDDLSITAAREKLDEFLEKNIESSNDFIKPMVIDAFKTQRTGSLDTKQVLKLTRYEDKINSPLFSEAIKLIKEGIRRPKSKTYRRVWIKDDKGKYEIVELNISSL